ncbi:MAG: hypothetical protein HY241_10515 [Actinobacteria bacterium]|nr:hypothetical protein [Actinomycetota bacterium]
MKRLLARVASNIDAYFALALAVAVGVLGFRGAVKQETVNNATLLVLAVVAETILLDRWRQGNVEMELREALGAVSAVLQELPDHLDRLTPVEGVLAQARTAFENVSLVRVLHGSEVGQALAEARRHTDFWYFKGGTGTFVRAVTLPECIGHARRRNGTLDFRIEILDPADEELCGRYALFRRSLSNHRDAAGEQWTVDRTRKEAFATVLAACWHQQQSGLLKVGVWLSAVMTTFRFDLSSTCVIITQEDPRAPALMVDRDKFYYHRWNIELQHGREQARQIPIEPASLVFLDDEPTVEQTRRLFAALALPLPRSFSDRDVSDIVGKAIQARNPYE